MYLQRNYLFVRIYEALSFLRKKNQSTPININDDIALDILEYADNIRKMSQD